ncbi:MAG TPA: hypothetical protein VL093_02670 [Flavipsychrobacter sp.]|jgi:hypothetical protein|nr:hypothetical protein [Flavipsychrobacter sp.]
MVFKQIVYSSAIVMAVTLSACSQEEGAKDATTEQAESDAMLINTSPAMPGAVSAQPATVISSPAGKAQTATQGSSQAAKTVAAINPPHGQPGHDCAVAVGAPLNSSAGNQAPQAQQPTTTPAQSSTPAGNGSARINPPHGQPGHDCDVAVGAPLP